MSSDLDVYSPNVEAITGDIVQVNGQTYLMAPIRCVPSTYPSALPPTRYERGFRDLFFMVGVLLFGAAALVGALALFRAASPPIAPRPQIIVIPPAQPQQTQQDRRCIGICW